MSRAQADTNLPNDRKVACQYYVQYLPTPLLLFLHNSLFSMD
jgi:hypothetical protein